MQDFSNPAKRVLNFILEVHNKPDNISAAEVWANAFGLDATKAKSDAHEVNQKLSLLRHELDIVEQQMQQTKFSENLYRPYIQSLRHAITPNSITTAWKSYKVYFKPETILTIKYCAEILEPQSSANFEELQKLLSDLYAFKETLDSSVIDGNTFQFIVSQIEIIENAIKSYPITGSGAIKKAFTEGFSDLNAKAENISETAETKKVGKFWEDLGTASDKIIATDRVANALINVFNKGNSLAENIGNLLT